MFTKTHLLPIALAAALMLGVAGPSLAQDGCLGPDAARVEVQNGSAQPFSQFRGQIAAQAGGEVLSADLCRFGGRLVYQVSVLIGGRQVVNLTVDARSGTVL